MAYIWIIALIAGVLMFLLCDSDKKEIGRMLLFSAILSLLIVLAPVTVKLLH